MAYILVLAGKNYVMRISLCSLLLIFLISWNSFSQDFVAGEHYRVDGDYVEYIHGNLPLVISVPHGGWDKPSDIPERMGRFAKNQDIYTIEVAYEIVEEVFRLTGKYPYVIINHLHRTRLDANRSIEEAADGNPEAEKIWHFYHNRIAAAKECILKDFNKGLFIDLHGHRHTIERLEIGYLFSGEELRIEEDMLDEGFLNEYSSIRNLLNHNKLNLSFTQLIRGDYSLGSLLSAKGQICVPDRNIPYPAVNEPFFPGGYNTTRYGSMSGGTIDGVQIEIDLNTRTDLKLREKVGKDIAQSLIEYLSIHYFPEMPEIASYGETVIYNNVGE